MKTRGKNVVVLLTLLMVAITCLICYYYQRSVWPIETKKPIPVIFPKSFELHQPTDTDKFLSYLPHSGFHNQRIELENALLLAAYLNRTLLVPPVFFASPAMPWLRYEKLYERLLLQTKNGLDDCVSLNPNMPLPSKCLNSFQYTHLPWTFFFNLTDISTVVPLVFREEINYGWLYSNLRIKQRDIYFFKDSTPYEYQIRDVSLDLPLDRFNSSVDLDAVKKMRHRVLHFGSLFGSYRVLAEKEAHADLLRRIRSKMIFSNPVLLDAATRIVDQLGGTGSFVGMHIRVDDGIFKRTASILVDDIYHRLIDEYTDLDVEQVARYEGGHEQHDKDRTESTEYEIKLRSSSPIDKKNYTRPITVHHSVHQPVPTIDAKLANRLKCQKGDTVTNKFRNTVLYIATDALNPRQHPLFQKLFNVFPCTFTLDDFDELGEIKRLEVVKERVKLEAYLIPMIDAMVSAHGQRFLGTPHSTFSSYIERQLHPTYTRGEVQVMGLEEYLALE